MTLSLTLTQSWLPEPEIGFLPGTASVWWEDGELHLRADLTDESVSTSATAHGQKLWELGDVVELFLQRGGESGYREYQVAPNGFTLALHYPDITCVKAVRSGSRHMEEFLTDGIPGAKVTKSVQGWSVSLTVPLHASPGELFRVSCCRYDQIPGGPPVISSTSPHPVRDFHRPQDWAELRV